MDEPSSAPLPLVLLRLGPRRAEMVERWARLHGKAVRFGLGEKDFAACFGRELDRLSDPAVLGSADAVEAALRFTANCLARRGVPLAEVLAAARVADRAAAETPGADADAEIGAAMLDLERARFRAYSHVYLARGETQPRSCDQPLGTPGPLAQSRARRPEAHGIVGQSAAVRQVLALVEAAARGPRNVLVTGETGTGKELVARAIHQAAGGEPSRFVAVNCAGLPAGLADSELFGHARGAFTGASGDHPGLFRAAQGGTLFLDEVTEMEPETQAKLLRVLEDRAVRPVGSVKQVAVDVRVLASTNRDIPKAIAEGRFRADLYYRLQALAIHVPALRDRREDVPALVEHFLGSFCSRRCGCIWGVAPDAMVALRAYDWPGNVRELRNVVEDAVTNGTSGWIRPDDLPPPVQTAAGAAAATGSAQDAAGLGTLPTLADAEQALIRMALAQCGGNKVRAARALGISRHKLYDKLRRGGESE